MRDVAVLGVGMHPGQVGPGLVEYGVVAARAALADAQLDWRDVQLVSGANTIRNGYPGFVSGSTFAQALGWTGARIVSNYAACASGAVALSVAREYILSGACDVALVIGADTTPKGFLAPTAVSARRIPTGCAFTWWGRRTRLLRPLCAAPDGPLRRDRRDLCRVASRTAVTEPRIRTRATGSRRRSKRCSRRPSLPIRSTCSTSAPPATALPPSF